MSDKNDKNDKNNSTEDSLDVYEDSDKPVSESEDDPVDIQTDEDSETQVDTKETDDIVPSDSDTTSERVQPEDESTQELTGATESKSLFERIVGYIQNLTKAQVIYMSVLGFLITVVFVNVFITPIYMFSIGPAMQPDIQSCSFITNNPTDTTVEQGDIVLYETPETTLLIHRIIDVYPEYNPLTDELPETIQTQYSEEELGLFEGETIYVMQDNTESTQNLSNPQQHIVTQEHIKGTPLFTVGYDCDSDRIEEIIEDFQNL